MNIGSDGRWRGSSGARSAYSRRPAPEIVGVLAPGFELLFPPGTNVEQRPDIWIANRLNYNNANRNTFGLRPVGRLKPGVALARAQEEADAVSARIREQFPVSKGSGFNARSSRCTRPSSRKCGRRSWR